MPLAASYDSRMQEDKKCEKCQKPLHAVDLACPLMCRRTDACKTYMPGPIDTTKTPIVWVLGPPKSGKTTVYQKIVSKYGFLGVVNGDVVVANSKIENPRKTCLISALKRGVSVPPDVVMDMVKDHIIEQSSKSNGFIFDNYPPDRKEAQLFERIVSPVTAIIYMDASVQVLLSRIMAAYNQDEITARRILNRYVEDTASLRVEYANKIYNINSEYPKDSVFSDVTKVIENILERR